MSGQCACHMGASWHDATISFTFHIVQYRIKYIVTLKTIIYYALGLFVFFNICLFSSGTSPGGTNVVDYTDVGISTEAIVRGSTLYQYHTYYATIRGT